MRHFTAYRVGQMPYGEAHALQERLVTARQAGEIGDTILMLEHPKVITLGRAAKPAHILLSGDALRSEGYEVHETGRGGDVTFHGPGQLVMYPIVDLKPDREDVRRYVSDLEETMIRTCADYGITAARSPGFNGTWVGDRKIGAVGVRISRWVTMHGLALNVTTDLASFGAIVPCGIEDRGVTSLSRELGHAVSMDEVSTRAIGHFAARFEAELSVLEGAPRR